MQKPFRLLEIFELSSAWQTSMVGGNLGCVALYAASLDPLHYMILLGSKYDPNMLSESIVQLGWVLDQ